MMIEAEIGATVPQAKECQGMPETKREAWNRFSFGTSSRNKPGQYLDF